MQDANPVATPCDRSSGGTEESVGNHVPYREAVGYLMYLITETRAERSIYRVVSSSSNGSTN